MANIEAGVPALGFKKRKSISKKKIAIIILLGILAVATIATYFGISLINAINALNHPNKGGPAATPMLNASLREQDLLSYNSTEFYLPYVLIKYNSYNVSKIVANASLYAYPPPQEIYMLNVTNECFYCGDPTAITSALFSGLMNYGIIQSPSNVTMITPSDLLSVPNDSLIIVLNGLLPNEFLQNASGTNLTVLDYLLIRHDSILYVGQQFTNVLLPDSVVIPAQNFPAYLDTFQYDGNSVVKSGYYFNKTTFVFANGSLYNGHLTYTNKYNGSIAAFPNTPSSWRYANQTGSDVAKAIFQLFWLPKYASGTRIITVPNVANSSSEFGMVMNATKLPYLANFSSIADKTGSIRVSLAASAPYPYNSTNIVYKYIYSKPMLYNNGTLGIYGFMMTNQTVPLTFSIVTHSNTPINIQPHLSIYDLNNTQVFSTPLSFIHNVSNNFTFLLPYERLLLTPGRGYIIKLHSFYGTEYGGAFFNVSPIVLKIVAANITSDKFYFSVISDNQRVNDLPYSIMLNGLYPSKGVIKNGTIYYAVPQGTPTITGNLNFTINVSKGVFYYNVSYNPLPFKINNQYVELVIAVVAMIIIIVFVKAPNRDEFYIDVPSLPEEKSEEIKIKPDEIIRAFDALNMSYRWKYMPLSKSEIRTAITSYVRYNNIPVNLTYSNIERILDQLSAKNYLVNIDNLYAPSTWITGSKHDMEYLATFKKLRIFLVTHGYIFTDLDASTTSDIVATLHSERKYIVVNSETSKFQHIPVYSGSKTYIAFLNAYVLEDFMKRLYSSSTKDAEEMKMYISADYIRLIDADNPEELIN